MHIVRILLMAIIVFFQNASGAAALEYPGQQPVVIVPPYPPGGLADITSRALASAAEKNIGGRFVISPIPGGGGVVGTTKVAQSQPDGYTLLLLPNSIHTLRPLLRSNLKFNKDSFEPVAFVAGLVTTISVSKDARWNTLQELVSEARANPGKLTVALTAKGGIAHAMIMLFQREAGIKLQIVPFDGGPPATAAILGGHVDMVFNDNPNPGFRPLAAVYPHRVKSFPDTPTFAELGYKKVNLLIRYAIAAPQGTPEPILRKLEAAFKEAVQQQSYRDILEKQSLIPEFIGRDQAKAIMEEEYTIFKDLVESGSLSE